MRFSIVIPCHNSSGTIERAINSVLAQTFPDFELLVVDDGSTDDTATKIRGLLQRDVRAREQVRLLAQENKGPAGARNRGMREARGELFAFLDADDYWEADFLAEMGKLFDQFPEAGAACCNFRVIDATGVRVVRPADFERVSQPAKAGPTALAPGMGPLGSFLIEDYFLARATDALVINTGAVVLRRSTVTRVGFMREDLLRGEDTEYWARIAAHGILWAFHPRPLMCVDQTRSESLSRTRSTSWDARIPLPELWSRDIWPLLRPHMVASFTTLYLWRTRYLCGMFLEAGAGETARKAAREALPRATGRWFEWLHLWLVATLPSRLTWALWRGLAKVRSGLRSGFA